MNAYMAGIASDNLIPGLSLNCLPSSFCVDRNRSTCTLRCRSICGWNFQLVFICFFQRNCLEVYILYCCLINLRCVFLLTACRLLRHSPRSSTRSWTDMWLLCIMHRYILLKQLVVVVYVAALPKYFELLSVSFCQDSQTTTYHLYIVCDCSQLQTTVHVRASHTTAKCRPLLASRSLVKYA